MDLVLLLLLPPVNHCSNNPLVSLHAIAHCIADAVTPLSSNCTAGDITFLLPLAGTITCWLIAVF